MYHKKGDFIMEVILNKSYPKLKFPDWESVKKISKDLSTVITIFHFDTLCVDGELTFFEEKYDCKSDCMIYFDVFEGGYSGKNYMSIHGKFTKKDYEKICKQAQIWYEQLIDELLTDRSGEWEYLFEDD